MGIFLGVLVALIGSVFVAGAMVCDRRKVAAGAAIAAPPLAWLVGIALELRVPSLLYNSMALACLLGSACLALQRRWICSLLFAIPPFALAIRTYMADRDLHLEHQVFFGWVRGIADWGAVFAPLLLSLSAVALVSTFIERRPT